MKLKELFSAFCRLWRGRDASAGRAPGRVWHGGSVRGRHFPRLGISGSFGRRFLALSWVWIVVDGIGDGEEHAVLAVVVRAPPAAYAR